MPIKEVNAEEENKRIAKEYKELLRISYQTLSLTDKRLIRLAFDTAVEAHKNQRRKSGEAYIFHPIAVAKIVASEIGMDATSIIAALLHDVVEDTSYTLEDIKKLFGETVAKIVDGLTKVEALPKNDNQSIQAENFKKVILTLIDDVRGVIIKIADRLHNMQTMDSMLELKQEKIASETLYIYAPIAHRLGLYNIKNELENLSLLYTEPNTYYHIESKMKISREERELYIKKFSNILCEYLDNENIKYEIKGRPKTIYSIHQKIKRQNIAFEDVNDKFAIRIVYKSSKDDEKVLAWKIYSVITNIFNPNPLRLRDWITSPKRTGYEALHITVMGPEGHWVEVQIRSERMDEIAERGYAAHFRYKNDTNLSTELDIWIHRMKMISENNNNAIDFVQEFQLDLYENEIFVFTPDGDKISLPAGATPLDFAFALHTEIGKHTKSAKIDQQLVPLNYKLKTGDQIEIITSKEVSPKFKWLEYIKTAKARYSIRSSLKEREKLIINEGEELLRRKMKYLKIIIDKRILGNMVNYFKLKSNKELYHKVYTKGIDNTMLREYAKKMKGSILSSFANRLSSNKKPYLPKSDTKNYNYDQIVFGDNREKLPFSLSKCCMPVAGDDIFGFTTVSDGIKVHKKTCKNALSLQANYNYRILPAYWTNSSVENFNTVIELIGVDGIGLVSNVTNIVSKNMGVNMNSIIFKAEGDFFNGTINLEVKNRKELQELMKNIKKITGVKKVERKY